MSEYDGPARPLRWPLTNPLVYSRTTEDDADCEASSFVWPEDSDEQVIIPFKLSLNEYNVLANTIDVGSDLAYGEDAIRVTWLWLRNMRCQVMCCCSNPAPSFTDRLNSQTYITETSTYYGDTYNTWNTAGQTVASIAPDFDYGSGDPENIDKVTCLALSMLLTAIIESAKANKAGTEAQNRDMVKNLGNVMGALGTAGGAALAVGGGAAALVGFLGGPYLVLGLALSAVGLAIANTVWTTDLSVFNDKQAAQTVLCLMVNNLIGDTMTRDRFISGVAGGGFDPGSNEAKLAVIVQYYLYDLNTYLQFLTTGQGLYEVSDFGVLPDCGCEEPPAEGCTDLTSGEGDWLAVTDTGEYDEGTGYKGAYFPIYDSTALWFYRDALTGQPDSSGFSVHFNANVDITAIYLYLNDSYYNGFVSLDDVDEVIFDSSTIEGWVNPSGNAKVEFRIETSGENTWHVDQVCVYSEP